MYPNKKLQKLGYFLKSFGLHKSSYKSSWRILNFDQLAIKMFPIIFLYRTKIYHICIFPFKLLVFRFNREVANPETFLLHVQLQPPELTLTVPPDFRLPPSPHIAPTSIRLSHDILSSRSLYVPNISLAIAMDICSDIAPLSACGQGHCPAILALGEEVR